jgi:hypothetical protein
MARRKILRPDPEEGRWWRQGTTGWTTMSRRTRLAAAGKVSLTSRPSRVSYPPAPLPVATTVKAHHGDRACPGHPEHPGGHEVTVLG